MPMPLARKRAGHVSAASLDSAGADRNLPELTAEKFLLHPFSRDPDRRIYKTGDTARLLASGNQALNTLH